MGRSYQRRGVPVLPILDGAARDAWICGDYRVVTDPLTVKILQGGRSDRVEGEHEVTECSLPVCRESERWNCEYLVIWQRQIAKQWPNINSAAGGIRMRATLVEGYLHAADINCWKLIFFLYLFLIAKG